MPAEHMIRHGAPTLAGLKTGSLFSCPYQDKQQLLGSVRTMNQRLGAKGLRILPLRFTENRALIYLYRPKKLQQDLSDTTAANLLRCRGYSCTEDCQRCVVQLAKKLRESEEFPHEIGLFLGYPPEDVHGFIENGADQCKCTGCWKVYGDEAAAQKKFNQYKKCTRVYCDRWQKTKDIDRLTVAG